MNHCPLCASAIEFTEIEGPNARRYKQCKNCSLIFLDPRFRLTRTAEKNHYRKHENGIQHKGYVTFLNRAISPAISFLKPGMTGLDYGCGPVPTLSLLMEQKGFKCENYDPIFIPHLDILKGFDFIFATECFEHFFYPAKEMQQLKSLLRPQGVLIVMTERWHKIEDFKKWYYATDPTHVAFYHNSTFKFIEEKYGFERIWSDESRVVILKNGCVD